MADRIGSFENAEILAGLANQPVAGGWYQHAHAEIEALARRFADSASFREMIRHLSVDLTGIYDQNPRLGKLLGSHRRWFMTQVGYAIFSGQSGGGVTNALTASRIASVVGRAGIASHNTVASFVAEMVAYRFLAPLPGSEAGRSHPLIPTEIAVGAMNHWLMTNIAGIDRIDGGARAEVLLNHPALFAQMQATSIKLLLDIPEWSEPGREIMNFLAMEAGGLVLDGLISSIDFDKAESDMLPLGRVNVSKMARRFRVSRVNLDRVLRRACQHEAIGRLPSGAFYMSTGFFQGQMRRQALKFAVMDCALRHVLDHPGEPVLFS